MNTRIPLFNKSMTFQSIKLLFLIAGFSALKLPIEPVAIKNPFKNLYQVSESFHRSEQPKKKGFTFLQNQGFNTIINLREKQNDLKYAKGQNFIHVHYPIITWRLNESDILNVMQIIKDSSGKVLIHCKHGSDRTGCMVAAYRLVFQGWSKERALAELRREEFGYHEFWFPDIVELIQELNVEKLRQDLGISN